MANAKQHALIGAVVSGGLCLIVETITASASADNRPLWQRIDYGKVAAFTALGAALGLLPDLLEPATSPNHRQFFHSLTTFGLVARGVLGKHTQRWSPATQRDASIMAAAFLSHLVADGMTRKGCRGFELSQLTRHQEPQMPDSSAWG